MALRGKADYLKIGPEEIPPAKLPKDISAAILFYLYLIVLSFVKKYCL